MSDRRNAPNSGLGRRDEAFEWARRQAERVIASSAGQNRRTRRNNLRLARAVSRRDAECARLTKELLDYAQPGAVLGLSGGRDRIKDIKARLEAIMTDDERTRRRDAKQAQVIAQARAA